MGELLVKLGMMLMVLGKLKMGPLICCACADPAHASPIVRPASHIHLRMIGPLPEENLIWTGEKELGAGQTIASAQAVSRLNFPDAADWKRSLEPVQQHGAEDDQA